MTENEAIKILKRDLAIQIENKALPDGIKAIETAIHALEEVKSYRDAEKQGLLLRLPCKVGETVWFVGNEFVNDYEVRNFIVDETGVDCIQIAKEIDGRDYWNSFSIDDFNKTVFLAKEEAKQALAKMKEV